MISYPAVVCVSNSSRHSLAISGTSPACGMNTVANTAAAYIVGTVICTYVSCKAIYVTDKS